MRARASCWPSSAGAKLALVAPITSIGEFDADLRTNSQRLAYLSGHVRAYATTRRGCAADSWPAPILAGFYASDLLAGLELKQEALQMASASSERSCLNTLRT